MVINLGPKQYSDTANLEGTVEVTFLDGETLSLIYHWNADQSGRECGLSCNVFA